ncbi:MAG: hypothetical protein U0797_11095 [Gemmataceae bacterium]
MTLRGCIGGLALATTLATTAPARQAEKRYDGKTVAEWVELLKSADVAARRAAAFYLARAGGGRARP